MSEPAPEDTRFVTLAALKEWMRLPATLPENLADALDECLNSALENLTDKCGPLDSAERTYQVWPSGRSLVLPDTHLVSVSTITDPDGNVHDVPARRINRMAGVIEVVARGRIVTGEWTVTARTREHGDSLSLATKIIASHLYETQRGRAVNSATDAIMRGSTPAGDPSGVPKGFAIPSRAAELIRPFLRSRGM